MTLPISRRSALALATAAGALPLRAARAAKPTIRIGVLTDLNGPNSNSTGMGSINATRMAAEDFMKAHPDVAVEVLYADYQSKPDIAQSIARDWFDRQGVDFISNVNNSSAALAIATLVREKNKAAVFTAPASSDLTGKSCSPNHVQWTYDTYSLGSCTGKALVAEGGNTWFFIAADYTFGKLLASDTARAVTSVGGKILGQVSHPFPDTTDFSTFLLQAQASGAKVIGLANSGENTVNCVKQAAEFAITAHGQKLAALLLTIPDVHGIGLATAKGLLLTEAWYWDLNDQSRAFGKRFGQRMGDGRMPNMIQAGDYSAINHALKAFAALGVEQAKASGQAMIAKMKEMPVEDDIFGKVSIRSDGRLMNPMHLFQVKSPEESKHPWDYYKLVRTLAPEDAFRPLDQGACPMVKA
ncbi:MAG TPA: ABC transporter substrate-binding protein [Rhodopila sp.]|uniref:ABC transporter substrate-binding protein n=1 Tax=Rhodopila sp. TaxID=2480087 RepID=UPI002CA5122B|nr:ABC transporter substrate-binding protein [Rhodopila sp.]HVY15999.1 ABC transporter substrate-binding protein [Rhodopila sp.]